MVMVRDGTVQRWLTCHVGHFAFAALVVVASLNRETGIYLALAWLSLAQKRRDQVWGIGFTGLSAAVYFGLRAALGDPEFYHTRASLFERNLSEPEMFIPVILFFAVLIIPALSRAWRPVVRRLIPLAALVLVLFVLFAVWREVRLLWTLSAVWLIMLSSRQHPRFPSYN